MKIALVGIGKIAKDQHVPSIAASAGWSLAATCSRSGTVEGVEAFQDMETMLTARPDIEVVSLCLPPVPRFEAAQAVLRAGRHVMLEKPPGATLSECHALEEMARTQGVSLFATWHSRAAEMVAPARRWLEDKVVTGARITWKEDVRRWHPGQDWVFDPGGMGVFDPGINALSILTGILPMPVHLISARLEVPANRQGPIAAALQFTHGVDAAFDWRQEGPQSWDIVVSTSAGELALREGGARLFVDGVEVIPDAPLLGEYPRLYVQMAELVARGGIDMDLSPMRHVADAFLLGERVQVEPFHF